MTSNTKRSRRQRGSTIVETAIVLLTLIVVLVGIADFAAFLHLHQAITERTRHAVRTAAIEDLDEAAIKYMIAYGAPSIAVNEPPTGYFGMSPKHIAVEIKDRGLTSQRVMVKVSGIPFPIVSPLISGKGSNLPIRVSVPLELP